MQLKSREIKLSEIAYQAAVIFPNNENLKRRIKWRYIKGYWRVIGHLVMVALRSVLSKNNNLFSKPSNVDNTLILVTASNNQLNLARRVRNYIKLRNIIHLHYSGWADAPKDLTPIIIPINQLKTYIFYLIKHFWINRKELLDLHGKTRKFCLDKICEVFLLKFFLEQSNLRPKVVIIFTDLTPFGNLTAQFFRDESKIIYIPHSPKLHNYQTPKFYDFVVSHSFSDMEKRKIMDSKMTTSSDINYRWFDFPVDEHLNFNHRNDDLTIGICLKPEDNIKSIYSIFKNKNLHKFNLVVRPHPMYEIRQRDLNFLKHSNINFSSATLETSKSFVERSAVLVGRDSGIFAEASDLNCHIKILADNFFNDNYGLKNKKNVQTCSTWDEIADALNENKDWVTNQLTVSTKKIPIMKSLEEIFTQKKFNE